MSQKKGLCGHSLMKRNVLLQKLNAPLVVASLLCGLLLLSGVVSFATDDDLSREAIARELALVYNQPNPFNAHTTIYYNLLEPAMVTVDIFDLNGHWIETILDEYLDDGENFSVWKTDTEPSGTYIYRITVGDVVVYKKMSLVK